MVKTQSGISVKQFSTEEFAEHILSSPDAIYSFTTNLNDDNFKWHWYNIANVKIFDVRNIFINKNTMFGGAPFVFDLPDYNENIDYSIGEEQSMDCYKDILLGLEGFKSKYNIEGNLWYINEKSKEKITISFEVA